MHVLITGGAGFIGSNIAKYHIEKGDSVVIVDDLSTGRKNNIESILESPRFTFYHKNITSWRGLSTALEGVDRIYHMAAVVGMFHVLSHPVETLKVNINATFRLFETISSLNIKPLVIVASSSEVYGSQHKLLDEESALILESSALNHAAYAISKLSDESIALAFWHKHLIPTIVLRIFNTVGRNQLSRYGMVIPRFIKQAINNQDITVFGDGAQRRSFCNVKDSINLIELLAENPDSIGEIINLGYDEDISVNDLAEKIKTLANSKSNIVHIPFEEAYRHESLHIYERKPDLTKLLKLTQYQYQWNLDKTIKDIITHMDKSRSPH